MTHITSFYKNKCRDLIEQVNFLQNKINTLLVEKSRGFDVAQEQQNLLHPPSWYTNHGLPNPWDRMSPRERSREWQRHLEYWSQMDLGTPGQQGFPIMPRYNPGDGNVGRSAGESLGL